jgi:hypothetical protein
MKPAVWRLLATAAAFVLWIGYLLYLWLFTLHFRPLPPGYPEEAREPLVLSRPQFLAAPLVVQARIDEMIDDVGAPAVVEEVLAPPEGAAVKAQQTLLVVNAADCRRRSDAPPDWTGPGSYLLPVRLLGRKIVWKGESYEAAEVVSVPPSPGAARDGKPPRLYPATPEVLSEYRHLPR